MRNTWLRSTETSRPAAWPMLDRLPMPGSRGNKRERGGGGGGGRRKRERERERSAHARRNCQCHFERD